MFVLVIPWAITISPVPCVNTSKLCDVSCVLGDYAIRLKAVKNQASQRKYFLYIQSM
jgi:hypothetical protein